jgi:hypothetical protein
VNPLGYLDHADMRALSRSERATVESMMRLGLSRTDAESEVLLERGVAAGQIEAEHRYEMANVFKGYDGLIKRGRGEAAHPWASWNFTAGVPIDVPSPYNLYLGESSIPTWDYIDRDEADAFYGGVQAEVDLSAAYRRATAQAMAEAARDAAIEKSRREWLAAQDAKQPPGRHPVGELQNACARLELEADRSDQPADGAGLHLRPQCAGPVR